MKNILWLIIGVVLVSCNRDPQTPKEGLWRATLKLDNKKEIPFLLEYKADNTFVFKNGIEEINITDVTLKGDSIIIKHPVYEGVFKGIYTRDSIYGDFIISSQDRTLPFKMKQGRAERFKVKEAPKAIVTGNWEAVFNPDNDATRYLAKGVFEQVGHKVTGTFRTTTGDYRYLDGSVENDSLRLSTFDGAHAFLFEAKIKDSILTGMFYSGNHSKEPFTARHNDAFQLPLADSLTFMKEGFEKIEFSFPNTKGQTVSLTDERFNNKVVIVQIMGTWCPNCVDESKFYTEYFELNKSKDLEFVALAFEYAKTEQKAKEAITKFKKALDIPYPILLAQYGTSDKNTANKKLPMLDHILSYPTTIFIDKSGVVRKIHTGFNGPATGGKYDEYKKQFDTFVKGLIGEKIDSTLSK